MALDHNSTKKCPPHKFSLRSFASNHIRSIPNDRVGKFSAHHGCNHHCMLRLYRVCTLGGLCPHQTPLSTPCLRELATCAKVSKGRREQDTAQPTGVTLVLADGTREDSIIHLETDKRPGRIYRRWPAISRHLSIQVISLSLSHGSFSWRCRAAVSVGRATARLVELHEMGLGEGLHFLRPRPCPLGSYWRM